MSETLFCPAAWHSVAVRNNGDYRLCCYANVTEGSGILRRPDGQSMNMRTDSADEVRNHSSLKEVRREFLEGRWPASCQRCQTEEKSGLSSGRQFYLNRSKEDSDLHQRILSGTAKDGTVDTQLHLVEDLDIRFGNQCNLRCRMCGPTDSSAWYQDHWELGLRSFADSGGEVKLEKNEKSKVIALTDRFDWHQKAALIDQLPKDLSKLRRIYMAGGEPLLIQAHQDFLRELIRNGFASKISLEYNSNLTVLPEAILDLWSSFREVAVGVSMDGFGKFHEYLRYPGKFSVLERNLQKLDEQPKNIRAWLACTISILNAAHVADFMIWKWRQNYRKIGANPEKPLLSTHQVHQPAHLDLRSLPAPAKDWVEQQLNLGISKLKAEPIHENTLAKSINTLTGVIRYMRSQDRSAQWPKLWQKTIQLDQLRNQSFKDLEPELWKILDDAANLTLL